MRRICLILCLAVMCLATACAGTETVTDNFTAYTTTTTTVAVTTTSRITQTATVTVTPVDDSVSPAEAEIAARRIVEHPVFSVRLQWEGATLSEPVIYHAFDMTLAAYEFTVWRDGTSIGWIMIAGRKDWGSALEFSGGAAPSTRVAAALQVAIARGYVAADENPAPVLFYGGATFYSAQFGEKMKAERAAIELGYGFEVFTLPDKAPELQFDKDQARAAWAKILAEAGE